MKCTPLERGEILEEDRHKCCNVLCGILTSILSSHTINKGRPSEDMTYNMLPVLRIGEANAYGLVDEKYIGVRVPAFRMEHGGIFGYDPTRS